MRVIIKYKYDGKDRVWVYPVSDDYASSLPWDVLECMLDAARTELMRKTPAGTQSARDLLASVWANPEFVEFWMGMLEASTEPVRIID